MTACLYRSDYGPPDPGFDPFANDGALIVGFDAHATALATAWNLGQLEAAKRVIQRNETFIWCEPGYGWTRNPAVEVGAVLVTVGLILPYVFVRARARLRAGSSRRPLTPILPNG